VKLLEGGLEDISASRSRLSWGVDFPGADGHSVYVWFDALPNYITAIGYPDGPEFDERWPAALHIIGKDITRFHCVIWPAMLKSAGLELPETVWAHGFINFSGGKLSKSSGQTLEVPELIERHGPDALRYFLMREIPWDSDRGFGSADDFVAQFDQRYTSDLANDLGNLLNRVVAMVSKYRDGAVPGRASDDSRLAVETARRLAGYREQMDDFRLHRGIAAALELVRAGNAFVDETQPWAAAKAEADGADVAILDGILGDLVRALGTVAAMLAPFMPAKAGDMWTALGGDGPPPGFDALAEALDGLEKVRRGDVLFPRPE
jgi:methionyl-tRNA synthetase